MKRVLKIAVCGVFTLVALGVLGGAAGRAQKRTVTPPPTFPADIARWIKTDPPTGDDARGANHSRYEWRVIRTGDTITVVRNTRSDAETVTLPFVFEPKPEGRPLVTAPGASQHPKSQAMKVPGGWLLASDWGEWGGNLYWVRDDGGSHHEIYAENAGPFVQNPKGEIFALFGLSHMGVSRGGVLRLVRADEKTKGGEGTPASPWRAEILADLKEKALAVRAEADGSLLVVTQKRFVRVSPNGAVQNIIEKAFWGALYPNSLASDSAGRLYIGMRHGVARVTLGAGGTGETMRWLVPDKTFLHPSPAAL